MRGSRSYAQLQRGKDGLYRPVGVFRADPDRVKMLLREREGPSLVVPIPTHLSDWEVRAYDAATQTWLAREKAPDPPAPPPLPAAPSTPFDATVVIPTYSGGVKLERCLRTLREHHEKMRLDVVVSLDGGSVEAETRDAAERHGARFVYAPVNRGFSAAVNRGIRAARASSKCVVLLNDDVWFAVPTLDRLVDVLREKPDVGIVGARLLYPDGKIQHAGVYTKNGGLYHVLHHQAPTPEALEDKYAWAVTGALAAISFCLLNECGGLDERYGLALEDIDLCLTSRSLGRSVFYCGSVWAYHDEGATRGKNPEEKSGLNPIWLGREQKGCASFFKKWYGVIHPPPQWANI
jgi:GT2 family glycosyltransferase